MRFSKGHGTQNDFVVLPDVDAGLNLTPAVIAALCDRGASLIVCVDCGIAAAEALLAAEGRAD